MIRLLRDLLAERKRTNELLARLVTASEASAPLVMTAPMRPSLVSVTAPSSAKSYIQWNDGSVS